MGGSIPGRVSQRTPHWCRDLKGEYDFVRCKYLRGKEGGTHLPSRPPTQRGGTSGRGERECKEEGSEGMQHVEGMTGSSVWLSEYSSAHMANCPYMCCLLPRWTGNPLRAETVYLDSVNIS